MAQFWANGPEENGFSTSVIVVREPISKSVGLSTYVRRLVRDARSVRRRISQPQPLTVDGEPAFAVDYVVAGSGTVQGKLTHVRQVLVKRGPWVIFIRNIALPTQYATSLGALDEVLRNWHWL